MNKTITINIAGIVFHIDETAYEQLRQYLASIKRHFETSEGRDEIIADIESRIAEMFQARLSESRQVILQEDIEQVIAAMGKPEDFGDTQENTSGKAFYTADSGESPRKKLFRDPDDKVLGGVCSGISAYLNIDPIALRLIFAVAFFFFGTGLLLYLVLWLIIPAARTTAEKLQMRGEKVNIENIERSIREEIEFMKTRFRDFTQEAKSVGKSRYASSLKGFTGRLVDLIGQIAVVFLQVVLKVIAVLFVIIGFGALIVLVCIVTGLGDFSGIPLPQIYTLLFDSQGQQTLVLVSTALLIGVPFFALLYKGVRILFGIRVKGRMTSLVFAVLWFIGFALGIVAARNIAGSFAAKQSLRKKLEILQPAGKAIYLEASDLPGLSYNLSVNGEAVSASDFSELLRLGSVRLRVVKGTDSLELLQISSSRGKDSREALANAGKIVYSFSQRDSVFTFSPVVTLADQEKFRRQAVRLVLKVPVGKELFFSNSLEGILDERGGVTDSYDDSFLNHRWLMTEGGLKCLDCEAFDYKDQRHSRHRNRGEEGTSEEDSY
jgi:phage shock protein PspC (stress-responsive transcriptional regulator)